jgi:hypothetical protein
MMNVKEKDIEGNTNLFLQREAKMNQHFEIIIHGHLTPDWTVVFDGMNVICLADGNTLITGNLPDQAALYGLLIQLRDLGITLISVTQSTSLEVKP